MCVCGGGQGGDHPLPPYSCDWRGLAPKQSNSDHQFEMQCMLRNELMPINL